MQSQNASNSIGVVVSDLVCEQLGWFDAVAMPPSVRGRGLSMYENARRDGLIAAKQARHICWRRWRRFFCTSGGPRALGLVMDGQNTRRIGSARGSQSAETARAGVSRELGCFALRRDASQLIAHRGAVYATATGLQGA